MADDELKRLLQENAAEIQRHFDVAMESNRHAIGLIAEKVIRLDEKFTGLDEKVTGLDEKLDKTSANLARRIEQTAAETQAMI